MSELADEIRDLQAEARGEPQDRLNRTVAVMVALFSAFLAFAKIKDDNVVQAIQKAQNEVTDSWNQYQAKRQRQFQLETETGRMRAMIADGSLKAGPEVQALMDDWRREVARYTAEMQEIARKEADLQASLVVYNDQDDLFDFSDAFLTLSLVLLALAALTRVPWLLAGAILVGGLGMAYGVSGFLDFTWFKPAWLAALFGA
jgi:hypothetical protein